MAMTEFKAASWNESGLGALLAGFSRLTGASFFVYPPKGKAFRLSSEVGLTHSRKDGEGMKALARLVRQAREKGSAVFGAWPPGGSLFASPVKIGSAVPWVVAGRSKKTGDPSQLEPMAEILSALAQRVLKQASEIESLSSEVASCYEELSLLFDLGESVHRAIELKGRCLLLLQATASVVGAKKAYLALAPDQRGKPAPLKQKEELEVIASLGYEVPAMIERIRKEARLSLTKGKPEIRGRSRLLVPLQVEDRTIGVLGLGEKQNHKAFNSVDLKLLSTVASQVAVLVENARLYADLEALFLGVVQSLVSAIEARDPSTKGHSDRVKNYALEIGQDLGLPEPEMRHLELASMLHDIGKIGYSDAIFANPTSTLPTEYQQVVQRHSQVGEKILSSLAGFADIVPSIRWHHERYDGKGYPDGLKGEQIPLLARIVSVVDSYDAMTSVRSYRKTVSGEEAAAELVANSGGQFDPAIVEVFVRLRAGKEPEGHHGR